MSPEFGSNPERPKPTKLYHASRERLRVGTVLYPTLWELESGKPRYGVFMTTSPIPHSSIFTLIYEMQTNKYGQVKWHVYEVEPLGKVEYDKAAQDVMARQARIKAYVGSTRGIIGNLAKKIKRPLSDFRGEEEYLPWQSFVSHRAKIHGVKIHGRGHFTGKNK